LQSSTAAEGMHRLLGMALLHHCWVTAELCEVQNLIGVNAVTSKAVLSLPCRAALLQRACTGCLAWFLCITTG